MYRWDGSFDFKRREDWDYKSEAEQLSLVVAGGSRWLELVGAVSSAILSAARSGVELPGVV